jgi:hypothetical protein
LSWYKQCGMRALYGAVCWGEWIYGLDPSAAPGPEYPRPTGENLERILATNETIMGRAPSGRLWIWGEPPGGNDGWISDGPVALLPSGAMARFQDRRRCFRYSCEREHGVALAVGRLRRFYELVGGSLVPEPVPPPSKSSAAG